MGEAWIQLGRSLALPRGEDAPLLSALFHRPSIRRHANRSDKTAIELFLAGISDWDSFLQQIVKNTAT